MSRICSSLSKKWWSLVGAIVPGESYNKASIWHWNWAFPQQEGERDQTSGCQDNWQRHLDHTAEMTEWHSLPLIVFSQSLSLSRLLLFSPSHTLIHILYLFRIFTFLCLCPHEPSAVNPQGPRPMSPWHCYPWHLSDKVTPDDWWHLSIQGWAAICNITDMLCAFCMVLKAMSVQPCQVAGWISSNIMEYIIKVLVNKANVLSSRNYTMDLEIAKSLRWINGSFISRAEDNLTEIWGPFLKSCLWFCSHWNR